MNTEEAPVRYFGGRPSTRRVPTVSHPTQFLISSIGKYQATRSARINSVASIHFSLTFRKSTVPTLPYNMRVFSGPALVRMKRAWRAARRSRAVLRTGIVAVVVDAVLVVDGSGASGRDRRDAAVLHRGENIDGRPFGRDICSIVYVRAKGTRRSRSRPSVTTRQATSAWSRQWCPARWPSTCHIYGSEIRTAPGRTTGHC